MRLVVLSRSSRVPSTRRLVEAAHARGHQVRVMNPTEVALLLGSKMPRLQYGSKLVRVPDVVIPRIASSVASYGLPVLDQFVMRGALALNTARAIGQSRNPTRCLQRLSASGIEIPATVMARDVARLKGFVERLGGLPVLVKLLAGHERRGVMVCESEQSLEAALEAVLGLGHDIVMQEYVRQAGRDVRIFVVGGKALAAVARVPKPGRLSRTLARIARVEVVQLTDACRSAAERAAKVCELDVCAVDVLETKADRVKVFEVNASPALPAREQLGVDLADAIMVHAEAMHAMRVALSPQTVATKESK